MAKDQLNIQIPEAVQEQFVKDAKRYGFNSKAAVVADIVNEFHDAWRELQERVLAFKAQEKPEIIRARRQQRKAK